VQVRNINIGGGLGGEIPDSKRLSYALQHIHGIGRAKAHHIVCELGVENKYVKDLSKRELYSLRELLSKYLIGNDLVLSSLLYFLILHILYVLFHNMMYKCVIGLVDFFSSEKVS
jgi:hypothetical protein